MQTTVTQPSLPSAMDEVNFHFILFVWCRQGFCSFLLHACGCSLQSYICTIHLKGYKIAIVLEKVESKQS